METPNPPLPETTEKPLAVYTADIWRVLLGLLGVPVALGLTAYWHWRDGIVSWPASVALFGVCAWMTYRCARAWQYHDIRVWVYPDRFVCRTRGKFLTTTWEQVQAVFRDVQRHVHAGSHGVAANTNRKYIIVRDDGTRIVLNDFLLDVGKLGELLLEHVTPLLLQRAREAYAAGKTLEFGRFRLNQDGLVYGRKSIRLYDIKSVLVFLDAIHIIQRNSWISYWAVVRCAKLPNAQVLAALLQEKIQPVQTQ